MTDLAPALDDVFLLISDVVKSDFDGILIVAQHDVGLHATSHLGLLMILII